MTKTYDKTGEYFLDILEAADKTLSPGQLQQRIAAEGFDATTGAIRDACDTLREDGEVVVTGDPPKYYRVADVDERVRQYVRSELRSADVPLSVGQLQRRFSDEGLDATARAIDIICGKLVAVDGVEPVGNSTQGRYELQNGRYG